MRPLYINKSLVKIELALAKGKLKRDKRRDIEERESVIEIRRALKSKFEQDRRRKF